MKYRTILPIALALGLLVSLTACAKQPAAAEETPPVETVSPIEPAADDDAAILLSDETAIDFLEGVWTNNRGQYIAPQRGESDAIVWSTNISLPALSQCFLREGILYGVGSGGAMLQLMEFRIEDENTLRITNRLSEKTEIYLRETDTVDTTRLDNAYVFHSMRHAAAYLTGMWLNEAGNFLTMTVNENGNITFHSDLPCPDVTDVDFLGGVMCGTLTDADGHTDTVRLFSFDIQNADTVTVTCHLDGTSSVFRRQSTTLEETLLTEEYVFSSSQRAFSFLNGTWRNEDGDYFTVTGEGGTLSWKTNLPLDETLQGYGFRNGGLMATAVDENGESTETPIYLFEILSQDEITVTVCEDETQITLQRAPDAAEAP